METSLAELRRPNIELMQVHSLGEPASGERILPMARERDIGVITARPFAGGNLFQATRGPATSNPDHMRDNMGAGVGRLPDTEMRQQMEAFMDALQASRPSGTSPTTPARSSSGAPGSSAPGSHGPAPRR